MSVAGDEFAADHGLQLAVRSPASWTRTYLRWAALADCACALLAGAIAIQLRFANQQSPGSYLVFTAALPAFWWAAVALSGGYESRFIGVGSEEFRRMLNAALSLTACLAVLSYALKFDLARGYFMIALPCTAAFDLAARYQFRMRLHRLRRVGLRMQRVIAVGHAPAVADLVGMLRRDSHHGLSVVGACLARNAPLDEIADVPVCGGLDSVPAAVKLLAADTVAVLACPEMNGIRLRELAWELEPPAQICASLRPCSTSRGRARRYGPSPGCRCCTWITRSLPGASSF